MKKKNVLKRVLLLALVLGALLALTVMTASAETIDSGTCGDNLSWTLEDDGTLTISGTGDMEDYIYDGPILKYPDWSYDYDQFITRIVVEEGVTSIGDFAFFYTTQLTSVALPDSLTRIGIEAFSSCENLTDISIPDGVVEIGARAFIMCESLKEITIPSGVTVIEDEAFSGTGLISVYIPDGITKIGYGAFRACDDLTHVSIPAGVTEIGDGAFGDCYHLMSVVVDSNNPNYCSVDGVLYNKDMTRLLCYPAGKTDAHVIIPGSVTVIGDYAFSSCDNLETVEFPSTLTTIGSHAFSGSGLASLEIPSTVTSIGPYAFGSCWRLTSVTIPSYVKTVVDSMFFNSYVLSDVTIEEGVETIENYAFYGTAITTLELPASLTSFAPSAINMNRVCMNITVAEGNPVYKSVDGVLYSKDMTTLVRCPSGRTGTFVIPDGVKTIGNRSIGQCFNLTKVVVPGSVETIEPFAFYNTFLKTLLLPEGVKIINDHAFYFCVQLQKIVLPATLTHIADAAFDTCYRLTDVYYTGTEAQWNDIQIGQYGNEYLLNAAIAFECASEEPVITDPCGANLEWNLADDGTLTISGIGDMYDFDYRAGAPWGTAPTKVVIESGVTSIGNYAFYKCSDLVSVSIPDSVISIGEEAFGACTNLTSLTIPDSVTNLGLGAFDGCTGLESVKLSNSITNLRMATFYGCSSLKGITIPESVTVISLEAFENTGLVSIVIPDTVKDIGAAAFMGCKNLTSVTLGKGVTVIPNGLFWNCTALKEIVIPDVVEVINYNAFQASALETITLPASVTRICAGAFMDCGNLKTVNYAGSEADWNNIEIMENNECLTGANIVFDFGKAPAAPAVTGTCVASTGYPKLSWGKVDGAVSYNVYRATSKTGTYKLMKNTTSTSYTNTSAVAGTTYYYKVAAVAENGTVGEFSAIKTITCDLAQPVVKATNVAATGYNKLTWEAIPGATAYKVYRATSKTGTYTLMKTVKDGATSYVNSNAVAGTTYYYYVVAVMDGKDAATSAPSEIKISTCDLAQPVVKATNVASTGYNKLTWEAIPGATAYKVYRSTSKTGTFTLMKTVKDGTSYVNSNAVAGTTYYYYVVAVMDGKDAATSAKSEIKISTCDLPQPTMTLTAGTGKITVKWEKVEKATGYKIYRATSKDGTYTLVKTITSGDTVSWSNTGLTAGKKYYYKMVAILDGKDAATSAYSAVKYTTVK